MVVHYLTILRLRGGIQDPDSVILVNTETELDHAAEIIQEAAELYLAKKKAKENK